MSSLRDIIAYIIQSHPNSAELTTARLTKLVYLSDWLSYLHQDKMLSEIDWFFDNYGPFVWDVKDEVEKDKDVFSLHETINFFGTTKRLFSLKNPDYIVDLPDTEKKLIELAISKTAHLDWSSFIKFIYSTYPVIKTKKYSYFNFESLKKSYLMEQKIDGVSAT